MVGFPWKSNSRVNMPKGVRNPLITKNQNRYWFVNIHKSVGLTFPRGPLLLRAIHRTTNSLTTSLLNCLLTRRCKSHIQLNCSDPLLRESKVVSHVVPARSISLGNQNQESWGESEKSNYLYRKNNSRLGNAADDSFRSIILTFKEQHIKCIR